MITNFIVYLIIFNIFDLIKINFRWIKKKYTINFKLDKKLYYFMILEKLFKRNYVRLRKYIIWNKKIEKTFYYYFSYLTLFILSFSNNFNIFEMQKIMQKFVTKAKAFIDQMVRLL